MGSCVGVAEKGKPTKERHPHMNKILLLSTALLLGALSLNACTQVDPGYQDTRLDQSASQYQVTAPNQGVGDNMRNSTAGSTSDRNSTRYPVGSANSDSNPY